MPKRPVRRLLARLFLAITGWKPEGERPVPDRFVLIAAPHTTNWDFPYLLAFAEVYGVRVSWIGKHTLFRWPFGPLMRALGGIPIRRHKRENQVEVLARLFEARDTLALVIPAEGTRDYVEYWKSGFYHIARRADVPIVPSFLDYARKRGGFGPALEATGDVTRDMDRIRAFYAGRQGRFPERFGRIRLREEADADASGPTPDPGSEANEATAAQRSAAQRAAAAASEA